jgi:hypothetical protein
MKMTSWRTVLPVDETGRFTTQQLDRAVCLVMDRRRSHASSRPMIAPVARLAADPPSAPAARPVRTPAPKPRPRRGARRRKPQAGG